MESGRVQRDMFARSELVMGGQTCAAVPKATIGGTVDTTSVIKACTHRHTHTHTRKFPKKISRWLFGKCGWNIPPKTLKKIHTSFDPSSSFEVQLRRHAPNAHLAATPIQFRPRNHHRIRVERTPLYICIYVYYQ